MRVIAWDLDDLIARRRQFQPWWFIAAELDVKRTAVMQYWARCSRAGLVPADAETPPSYLRRPKDFYDKFRSPVSPHIPPGTVLTRRTWDKLEAARAGRIPALVPTEDKKTTPQAPLSPVVVPPRLRERYNAIVRMEQANRCPRCNQNGAVASIGVQGPDLIRIRRCPTTCGTQWSQRIGTAPGACSTCKGPMQLDTLERIGLEGEWADWVCLHCGQRECTPTADVRIFRLKFKLEVALVNEVTKRGRPLGRKNNPKTTYWPLPAFEATPESVLR